MLSFRVFAGYHFDSSDRLPWPRPSLSPLFATHTDSTSCKSFTCHSYENTGGVYELFPFRNSTLACPPSRAIRHSSLPIYPLCFLTLTDSSAQWRPATLLSSIASGLFPSQWGCTPPSRYFFRLLVHQSPLFPVVHPIFLQRLTKCSSRNSFALTTIHFHGGEGVHILTDEGGATSEDQAPGLER
jgi:hypothetical protein